MDKTKKVIIFLIILSFLALPVILVADNIDSTYKYSWGENIGWMNWKPSYGGTDYGVTVYNECLTGYIWAENAGWTKVGDTSCAGGDCCQTGTIKGYENDSNGADNDGDGVADDWGVNNNGSGNLSGYAWGENVGWINFSSAYHQVVINSSGEFTNYAWGENVGWINMNCANTNYCGTVDFKVKTSWTANTAPTVDSVSLNSGNNIILTESTTTLVSATGTVSDANGYADISSVQGKLYRSGVGSDCSTNNSNCYEDTSCATSSCSGNVCDYSCDFNVYFYAEPTDDGKYASSSGWTSQHWEAWVKVIDSASASSTATNSAETVNVNTLTALDVDSSITYDALDPNTNMANLTKATNATNTGNVPIDIQLKGDDMTYEANSIAVSNQRYSTTTNDAWANGIQLTSSYVHFEVDLPKPTQSPSNSTTTIYWGWQVPTGKPSGTYTGTNYFNAVED